MMTSKFHSQILEYRLYTHFDKSVDNNETKKIVPEGGLLKENCCDITVSEPITIRTILANHRTSSNSEAVVATALLGTMEIDTTFRDLMQEIVDRQATSLKSPVISEKKYNAIGRHLIDPQRRWIHISDIG